MHEREKLKEAKYFYSRFVKEKNIILFKYNLSAFLSPTRSILQYARKEAQTKPGGLSWYNSLMSSSVILRYFRDKRNTNIHDEPVVPATHYVVSKILVVRYSYPDRFIKIFGKIEALLNSLFKSEDRKSQEANAKTQVTYKFKDWNGNEDIITLCQKYIQELENLIHDGVSNGFISG